MRLKEMEVLFMISVNAKYFLGVLLHDICKCQIFPSISG